MTRTEKRRLASKRARAVERRAHRKLRLTESDVREIRAILSTDMDICVVALAKRYGVGRAQVYEVRNFMRQGRSA